MPLNKAGQVTNHKLVLVLLACVVQLQVQHSGESLSMLLNQVTKYSVQALNNNISTVLHIVDVSEGIAASAVNERTHEIHRQLQRRRAVLVFLNEVRQRVCSLICPVNNN